MVPMPDLSFGDPDVGDDSFMQRLGMSFARQPLQAPPPEMQVSPLAAFLTNFGARAANDLGGRAMERNANSPRNATNRLALGHLNLKRQQVDKDRASEHGKGLAQHKKDMREQAREDAAAAKEARREAAEAAKEAKAARDEAAKRPGTPEYAEARFNRVQAEKDRLGDDLSIYRVMGLRHPNEAKPKTPAGMMVDEDGNIVPKPVTAKGTERQALAFYNRAKAAEDNLAAVDKNGNSLEDRIGKSGLLAQTQAQRAPDFAKSPEQRIYRQAQRAFTEARLRKESGAAISPTEYENDSRIYFVRAGDDPATIEQKKAARQAVLDGLANAAGPAYDEWYGEPYGRSPKAMRQRGTTNGKVNLVGPKGERWIGVDEKEKYEALRNGWKVAP
jgi:hypothetical protein